MDCLTPFPVRGGQIAESTGMSKSYAIRGHVGAHFLLPPHSGPACSMVGREPFGLSTGRRAHAVHHRERVLPADVVGSRPHSGLLRPAGRVSAPHVPRRREVRHRPGGASTAWRRPEQKGRPGGDRPPAAAQAPLRGAAGRRRAHRQPDRGGDAARRPAARPTRKPSPAPATRTRRACRPGGRTWGSNLPFLFDLMLRTIYTRGQITGGELAGELAVPFASSTPSSRRCGSRR